MRQTPGGEEGERQRRGIIARSGWKEKESELWESARAAPACILREHDGQLVFAVDELDEQARRRLQAFYSLVTPQTIKDLLEELAKVRVATRDLARAVREHPDLGGFMVSSFMRDDFDGRLHGALVAVKAVSHDS